MHAGEFLPQSHSGVGIAVLAGALYDPAVTSSAQQMPDAVGPAPRSNAEWLAVLERTHVEFEAAWLELRALLVSGLRRAVGERAGHDACEDFAQDALVRILDRLDQFRGDSRFTTWAMAIAVRTAFDAMRHAHWKDVSFDVLTSEAEGGVQFEAADDGAVERRLTRERVLAVLHDVINTQLTERQRRVIVAELQGMPQLEIAEQLQMNRNALYKLSHDARRKLKAQLELAGMVAADVLWAFI